MRCVPVVDLGRAGMSRTRAAAATGDATGDDLHNHNRAIDPVQRRRDYMKAWRIAHGQGTPDSYMARKARERREAIQNVANDGVVATNNDA